MKILKGLLKFSLSVVLFVIGIITSGMVCFYSCIFVITENYAPFKHLNTYSCLITIAIISFLLTILSTIKFLEITKR